MAGIVLAQLSREDLERYWVADAHHHLVSFGRAYLFSSVHAATEARVGYYRLLAEFRATYELEKDFTVDPVSGVLTEKGALGEGEGNT